MRRIIVAFSLAVATLLVGSIGSTSAIDYSVSLGCSDGTQFSETLSAANTIELADAVTAINTNPAGLPPLACTLSQTALSGNGAQAAGSAHDFAVGGGQWLINGGCDLANFSMNAHVDSNSITGTDGVGGHFNLTIRQDQCSPPGHLKARVDCLEVTSNVAEIRAVVQSSSGAFVGFLDPGDTLHVQATDNDPDKLAADSGTGSVNPPCGGSSFAGTAILRGNIKVHVGDGDVDSFSDRVESSAGTDPEAKCPSGPTHNAWPADVNNDGFADTADISALTADFGKAVPQAPARHNIAPDPVDAFVDTADLSRVTALFGKSC